MLKKIQIEDCKPVSTPMITGCKLSKEDESKEVDSKDFEVNDWQSTICNSC